MTLKEIKQKKRVILKLAELHGVKSVKIFGSVAKGYAGKGSDIDFLIEMEKDKTLLDRLAFMQSLKELLKTDVDVVSKASLKKRVKSKIEKEALSL